VPKKLLALILLVCLVATPLAFLAKVEATSPTLNKTGQLSLPDGIFYDEKSFVASGNFLYLYCSDESSDLVILKVDETTMTIVANCTSDIYATVAHYPMFVIGSYLYCLASAYNDTTFGIQDYVLKISTSAMTVSASFSDPNGSDVINGFGCDSTYLYINEYLQPPYDYVIYKVDPATMTVTLTSAHFADGLVKMFSYQSLLLGQANSDNSLYEIRTSNLTIANTYIVNTNFSATLWSSVSLGASNIFSGVRQHVIKSSYTDFSQVAEWNDANDDFVSSFVYGNYVVAGLMFSHSESESYGSVAIIDQSSMTLLATADAPNATDGYRWISIFSSTNSIYGYFRVPDSPDVLMQFQIVAPSPTPSPTPVHHGGGADSQPTYAPTSTPSSTPSQSPNSSGSPVLPVTNATKITATEIFAVTVLIALSVASWMFLASRRRR
jgi:hypothetical protein